jgi:hypothetical protein
MPGRLSALTAPPDHPGPSHSHPSCLSLLKFGMRTLVREIVRRVSYRCPRRQSPCGAASEKASVMAGWIENPRCGCTKVGPVCPAAATAGRRASDCAVSSMPGKPASPIGIRRRRRRKAGEGIPRTPSFFCEFGVGASGLRGEALMIVKMAHARCTFSRQRSMTSGATRPPPQTRPTPQQPHRKNSVKEKKGPGEFLPRPSFSRHQEGQTQPF